MTLTIKDIARYAGVSPATVSLSLKDDSRVAEKTREKVKKISKKFNYVPNNIGRALQSNKTSLAGYLISTVTSSYFNELLQGAGNAAAENNYGLLVGITSASLQFEKEQLQLFYEKRVDGIIASGYNRNVGGRLSELNKMGIPVVICSGLSADKDIPYILVDNVKGGLMAAEHLIELGHETIAYGFSKNVNCGRYQGCCKATSEKGISKPILFADEKGLIKLLKSKNRPTGIVAYSDAQAIRIKHIVESAGLSIPENISLIGFDDIWTISLPEYNFSSIAIPKMEIGRQAMEMLLDRINGKKVESRLIAPELIVRGSTCELNRKS